MRLLIALLVLAWPLPALSGEPLTIDGVRPGMTREEVKTLGSRASVTYDENGVVTRVFGTRVERRDLRLDWTATTLQVHEALGVPDAYQVGLALFSESLYYRNLGLTVSRYGPNFGVVYSLEVEPAPWYEARMKLSPEERELQDLGFRFWDVAQIGSALEVGVLLRELESRGADPRMLPAMRAAHRLLQAHEDGRDDPEAHAAMEDALRGLPIAGSFTVYPAAEQACARAGHLEGALRWNDMNGALLPDDSVLWNPVKSRRANLYRQEAARLETEAARLDEEALQPLRRAADAAP